MALPAPDPAERCGGAGAKCLGSGGAGSIGAVSRYGAVRQLGDAYFDADPHRPGGQRTGPRRNN